MNLNNEDNFSSNRSISTIVEISEKVTELLDNMEYSNTEMLITREHIKYNLAQLILSSNAQLNRTDSNLIRNIGLKRRRKYNFSSSSIFVDNRGKLNINIL